MDDFDTQLQSDEEYWRDFERDFWDYIDGARIDALPYPNPNDLEADDDDV